MNFDWKQPKVFRQSNHLISKKMSDRFFFRKKNNEKIHIYQPWSNSLDNELLFKVKSIIHKQGETFIPFIDTKGNNYSLSNDDLSKLKKQISSKQSVSQLVMFNGDVIHVLRIKDICTEDEFKGKTLACLSNLNQMGMIVDDIYVYFANHLEDSSSAYHHLKNLIATETEISFFDKDFLNQSYPSKWKVEKRSFTYNYYLKSNELKEFTFQSNWEDLSLLTRHYIVQLEVSRTEYMGTKGFDQWRLHDKAMKLYSAAFLNELSATFVFPLKQVVSEFSFVKHVITELIEDIQDQQFKMIMERIFLKHEEEFLSINDFYCFIQHIKFFTYSASTQIAKSFYNEEFLWVENFLNYYQGFSESLLTKKLIEKMCILNDCENWFKLQNSSIKKQTLKEHENANLKASQLIRLLTSSDPQENLFFTLLEVKTEKAISKKSIEKNVADLIGNDLLKLAS